MAVFYFCSCFTANLVDKFCVYEKHRFMCGACVRKVCQEKLVCINLGGKDQQSCKGFKPGSRQENKVFLFLFLFFSSD